MNGNDELLQRMLDNDLQDAELKRAFEMLGSKKELREQFRSLVALKNDLHALAPAPVPSSLDERVDMLLHSRQRKEKTEASPLRLLFARKIRISVPAIAAAVLLLLLGSFFAATSLSTTTQNTEYVYVVEMPPYVVQSTVYDVVNN